MLTRGDAGLDMSGATAAKRPLPVKRLRHPLHSAFALAIGLIVILPVLSLVFVALSGNGEDWPHLIENVLPGATRTTLALLAMVAVLTTVGGVACAWAVVAYDFPFRRTLSWALVLPLAVPPYLAAYAFGEFFHYQGPVQSLVRSIFGFQTAPPAARIPRVPRSGRSRAARASPPHRCGSSSRFHALQPPRYALRIRFQCCSTSAGSTRRMRQKGSTVAPRQIPKARTTAPQSDWKGISIGAIGVEQTR